MKLEFIYLFLTLYIVNAVPFQKSLDHSPYPRFIKFPGGDGDLQDVDLEAEPNVELLEEVLRNPANNRYDLYTRSNTIRAQVLQINNVNSITSSNFNPSKQTIVVSHGWFGNGGSILTQDVSTAVRNAYLGRSDVNVIVLDWSRLAWSDYVTAALGVPAVGRGLGQFLRFLSTTTGAPLSNMHLVGFSLGAHLVGNAGKELGGQVARITGLDPAGPLWNLNSNRLSPSDARYVEAIHTDGGYTVGGLGIGTDVADVDFYPNGGVSQPGCLTNLCNHDRSWELFAATVSYNHLVGQRCTTSTQVSWDLCRGESLAMGNDALSKNGNGKYRVNTARRYPY